MTGERAVLRILAIPALVLALGQPASAGFVFQGLSSFVGPPNCVDPHTTECGRPHPVPHLSRPGYENDRSGLPSLQIIPAPVPPAPEAKQDPDTDSDIETGRGS